MEFLLTVYLDLKKGLLWYLQYKQKKCMSLSEVYKIQKTCIFKLKYVYT